MLSAEEFIEHKNDQWMKNRRVRTKDIGRAGFHWWERDKWTFLAQTNYPGKVLVIERLRYAGNDGIVTTAAAQGAIQLRIGYYVVGKIGTTAGGWRWGQFSPFIPEQDFKALLDKAKREYTL